MTIEDALTDDGRTLTKLGEVFAEELRAQLTAPTCGRTGFHKIRLETADGLEVRICEFCGADFSQAKAP